MIKGKNSNGKFRKLYYLMSKTPLLSDLNSIQLKLELKTDLIGLLKEENFFLYFRKYGHTTYKYDFLL